MSGNKLVALDIGTRSVIGLVLEKSDCYKVVCTAVEEHRQRTMLDGQIHDIPMVANTVSNVINMLEEQLGEKIEKVAVAAAGRSLITINGCSKLEQELHQVEKDEIIALEFQAVQSAQRLMAKEARVSGEYYCVGFTVLNYYLDGIPIRNLIGQTGRRVEVEVIATFLPRVVIDSLIAVLNQSHLKVKSLTLEPIAAAEIAIPDSIRQLNLALIDIGAGTSDIAITSNGKLIGYAMVPVAGDEITEKIAEHYLLDFSTAEKVKRNLNRKQVKFKDVLGSVHSKVPSAEVKDIIGNTVDLLARKITTAILELNSKPPQAIICIGGGSLTPGIAEKIALALDLPVSRVVVKGQDCFRHIEGVSKVVTAQQLITPLGIGLNSFSRLGLTYYEVFVNDISCRLLALNNLTVADALISVGIDLKQLFGKPGKALTIEINGEVTFLRGKPGVPAKITLNGISASIDTNIKKGDKITFLPARDGEDCNASLQDILTLKSYHITINQKEVTIEPDIQVNGKTLHPKSKIKENSILTLKPLKVRDVIYKTNYNFETIAKIKLNGVEASGESLVKNKDEIELISTKQTKVKNINVIVNNRPKSFNWDKNTKPILSDILALIDLDLSYQNKNKRLIMLVNNKEAGFITEIEDRDNISLIWDNN